LGYYAVDKLQASHLGNYAVDYLHDNPPIGRSPGQIYLGRSQTIMGWSQQSIQVDQQSHQIMHCYAAYLPTGAGTYLSLPFDKDTTFYLWQPSPNTLETPSQWFSSRLDDPQLGYAQQSCGVKHTGHKLQRSHTNTFATTFPASPGQVFFKVPNEQDEE
jgi:hypothetical protein